ncbi:MAG: hypothetical protein SGPRY_006660, partial [Prymnesium sp.]
AALAAAGFGGIDSASTRVFFLGNASTRPTAAFWSPGLSAHPPRFVRSHPQMQPMIFRHVVLAQPATECWWWNVWKPDQTDRRALFTQFRTRMLHNIQHQTEGPSPPDLVLILQRPAHTDRRLLNEAELAEGLTANLSSLGLRVDLKDLGQMSTQEQMTLMSSVAVESAGAA